MEDRDGKKPFIIPKTHTANKDVVITEKPDSRNVTELFNDIKSCALEAQFDFRPQACKSCDTIRNQKLQKSYNEKRLKMKKEQDPVERLAFHLVTYRPVALSVANDGLRCEQLSFPISKFLGNPKDGVHLSKRPDVLLTSSGAQGLYRFGLLVCKVLLGKGYATIPSEVNKQLPAQVNYDHHFCKIQSVSKEQQHIDDLLANSLIFCYDHENFEPVSQPSQILPIAILWYDLTDRFAPELIPASALKSALHLELHHRNGKAPTKQIPIKNKLPTLPAKPTSSLPSIPAASKAGTWEEPVQKTTATEQSQISHTIEPSSMKYPNHMMVPYHRVYSTPLSICTNVEELPAAPSQTTPNSRDPRLSRAKREAAPPSSETIPLSPQQLSQERSLSDSSLPTKLLRASSDESPLIGRSSSSIYIPLNSSSSLLDPRLKTVKTTRTIFYLESQAVKRACHQQKRLSHYHDSKSGLPPKTSYTVVPYVPREVSTDEYERLLNAPDNTSKLSKHSSSPDYAPLHVSVTDCFNFGLVKPSTTNEMYIDLEQSENRLAYEQMEMSNELIEREKQLNSQYIRLRLREKRQKRMQQQLDEKKNYDKLNSKVSSIRNVSPYIVAGRKLLKEHKPVSVSPNTQFSPHLLDFFSQEYKTETRTHVKQLLAELVGIFIDKYRVNTDLAGKKSAVNGIEKLNSAEKPLLDSQPVNSVIDMDLDSPSSQGLCDLDERFRQSSPVPSPSPIPPPLPASVSEAFFTQSIRTVTLTPTLPTEPNKVFDDPEYNDRCHQLLEQLEQHREKETRTSNSFVETKTEALVSMTTDVFQACLGQSSSSEDNAMDDIHPPVENEGTPDADHIFLPLVQDPITSADDDPNRSRDEFVKLLTKEAFISKSSSPVEDQSKHNRSYQYHHQRRRSHDDDDSKTSSFDRSGSHRHYSRPLDTNIRRTEPEQKRHSSTRTVTLVSNRTAITTENQNGGQQLEKFTHTASTTQDEPTAKRLKVDLASSSSYSVDDVQNLDDTALKSVETAPSVSDEHDCRRDLNEKRRTVSKTSSVLSTVDHTRSHSSGSRSRSRSKDRHYYHHQRSTATSSRNTSTKDSQKRHESGKRSRAYSSSPRSPSNDNHRQSHHRANREEHRSERKPSFDVSSSHPSKYANQPRDQHESLNGTSYRNRLPTTYHQRNVTESVSSNNLHHSSQPQPVRHRRFNYNHQSVTAHPRFATVSALPSSTPLADFNYSKSPTHHRNSSPVTTVDRNVHPTCYKANSIDQNEPRKISYTNVFDSEPSPAIKSLRMLLQKETTDEFEHSPIDYASDDPGICASSRTVHDNSRRSSTTSSSSSKTNADTFIANNNRQTFTNNDNEKLLSMIQRAKN